MVAYVLDFHSWYSHSSFLSISNQAIAQSPKLIVGTFLVIPATFHPDYHLKNRHKQLLSMPLNHNSNYFQLYSPYLHNFTKQQCQHKASQYKHDKHKENDSHVIWESENYATISETGLKIKPPIQRECSSELHYARFLRRIDPGIRISDKSALPAQTKSL